MTQPGFPPHAIVTVDGKTHVRHPRWSRLAVCGVVLNGQRSGMGLPGTSCSACRRDPAPRRERKKRPDMLACRLRCACGAHHERKLPADEPLKAVLSRIGCPTCAEIGHLHLAPSPSQTP